MKTRYLLSLPLVCLASTSLLLGGCTQPGETTGIGAAAGGALGAGLGAIIGSQSGSAGSGLAIGAVAGSASGALIGNAFQAQQEAIRTQDEALERQERMMQAQKAEIDELRRIKSDPEPRRTARAVSRSTTTTHSTQNLSSSRRTAAGAQPADEEAPRAKLREDLPPRALETSQPPPIKAHLDTDSEPLGDQENGMVERDLTTQARPSRAVPPVASTQKREVRPTLGDFEGSATSRSTSPSTPSCTQADEERQLAASASEVSEKLFHLRRALRLCPNSAVAHHELGKVYLSLKRPSDAEYEFTQALKTDPNYKAAVRSLEQLKSDTSNARF